MSDRTDEIAGMYVQGRGTQRSIVAGATAGAVGRLLADRGTTQGPLGLREVGYLSVTADTLSLLLAKRRHLVGAFRPTAEVVASEPRARVADAQFDKGKVGGTLAIAFDDGKTWKFDVPRFGNKGADQAVAAIAATQTRPQATS